MRHDRHVMGNAKSVEPEQGFIEEGAEVLFIGGVRQRGREGFGGKRGVAERREAHGRIELHADKPAIEDGVLNRFKSRLHTPRRARSHGCVMVQVAHLAPRTERHEAVAAPGIKPLNHFRKLDLPGRFGLAQ
ncbi:hypothetical protein BMS3Bbin10_01999 [bacterium BMS3Bbin10]|nr:hypothetical protein BMS3Bbin10_01999 [bacterium BMS3Bbin10]